MKEIREGHIVENNLAILVFYYEPVEKINLLALFSAEIKWNICAMLMFYLDHGPHLSLKLCARCFFGYVH